MEDEFQIVWESEIKLLTCDDLNDKSAFFPIVEKLQRGDYGAIIESDKIGQIFNVSDDFCCESNKPLELLSNAVNNHLSNCTSVADQFEVLCIGVACMNAFVQSNWTGPNFNCPESLSRLLLPSIRKFSPIDDPRCNDSSECIRLSLSEDGEEICVSLTNPELLVAALAIFGSRFPELKTPQWWLLRATYLQQQILDEQSPSLLERLNTLSDRVLNFNWVISNKYLVVLSHLEVARIYLHFGKIESSDKEITKALSLLKMDISFSGALGQRTYYQCRDIAQLTLNVKVDRDSDFVSDCGQKEVEFPKDVVLNDEVRMPNIAFSNPNEGVLPDLLPLEQATLLAAFVFKKKSQAKDQLLNEELMPYLNGLLSHPKVWSLQLSVLHLRSRLECDHKRTVERSLLQTQALMELDSNSTSAPARQYLFYCSYAPPSFIITSECASILLSLGQIQSALDLYLQLQMWEEVIACYNYLKLRHKAAEVIREQLKKGETVKLLCYLGDAIDDVSCYERAWELSNHRSAQAQRHWGMYYFKKMMYKESIEHFNLSLSKNSLQIALWFRLGYANLMEARWEESAAAYRRYCTLEPGSFEAWNNMAKAYILLGQKNRAYHALQEAIKCNYETWQVWDNLMAVSSDCGEFEEVIHCYHRILDLKDKHIDEQILTVLTSVILKNVKDCRGQPASLYRKKALELFGRITSKVMGNPTIWLLYAELTADIEDQTPITQSKVIHHYQKAYTVATQDNSWYKDFKSMQKVLNICEKLAEANKKFVNGASPEEAARSLSSAKFSLTNFIAKVNEQLQNMENTEMKDSFISGVSSLQRTLESVQTELTRIKIS